MRVIDLLRGWDANGDGIVSKPEFVKALRALGFNFEPQTAAQLFTEFDADGSGKIDLKELKCKLLETEQALEAQRDADEPDETSPAAAAAAAAPALTSLDLADNQLGGGALGPLLRVLRGGACPLRALDLSRNRLPERACTYTCTCIRTCIHDMHMHMHMHNALCQHANMPTCQHANMPTCQHMLLFRSRWRCGSLRPLAPTPRSRGSPSPRWVCSLRLPPRWAMRCGATPRWARISLSLYYYDD